MFWEKIKNCYLRRKIARFVIKSVKNNFDSYCLKRSKNKEGEYCLVWEGSGFGLTIEFSFSPIHPISPVEVLGLQRLVGPIPFVSFFFPKGLGRRFNRMINRLLEKKESIIFYKRLNSGYETVVDWIENSPKRKDI